MTVKARKEVIVAAGALQSPKILEVSDVGSAKLLGSHNIDVQIGNPYVGENLQNYILCFIGFEAKDHVNPLDDLIRQDPKSLEAPIKEGSGSRDTPFCYPDTPPKLFGHPLWEH